MFGRTIALAAAASLSLFAPGPSNQMAPPGQGRRSRLGPGRFVAPYLDAASARRAVRRLERAERALDNKGVPICTHIEDNAKLAQRFLAGAA